MSGVNKVTLHQALRGRNLNSTQRDVLQALASYGSYGLTDIRPALDTVAQDYGLNIKTVRGAVKDLHRLGYLHRVKAGAGRGNPSQYNIVIPASETLPSNGTFSLPVEAVKGTASGAEKLPFQSQKGTVSRPKHSPQMGVNQLKTSSRPVKRDQQASPPTAAAAPTDASSRARSTSAKNPKGTIRLSVQEFFSSSAKDWKEWGAVHCPGVEMNPQLRDFRDWYEEYSPNKRTRDGWYRQLHKWLERPRAEAAERIAEQAKRHEELGDWRKLETNWDDEPPAPTVTGGQGQQWN